jgi:hypothetical protein
VALRNSVAAIKQSYAIPSGWLIGMACVTVVFATVAASVYFKTRDPGASTVQIGDTISSCIHQYYTGSDTSKPNVDLLYQMDGFCYNFQIAQLIVEEEAVRRDNFIFQRAENVALLAMVISITISGVALAGLQLLASYKLASIGKGEMAKGGEATIRHDSVVVKSSVVGVVILAISFAFFMVFVIYVYTLKDDGSTRPMGSPDAIQSGAAAAPKPANTLQMAPPAAAPARQFNLNPVPKAAPSATDH